jgi:hypothetical protein
MKCLLIVVIVGARAAHEAAHLSPIIGRQTYGVLTRLSVFVLHRSYRRMASNVGLFVEHVAKNGERA